MAMLVAYGAFSHSSMDKNIFWHYTIFHFIFNAFLADILQEFPNYATV